MDFDFILLNAYEKHSFTHNYIFTITIGKTKIACFIKDCKILSQLVYYDKNRKAIRFRPNKKQKNLIISVSDKIIPLCSTDFFNIEKARKIPNKNGKLTTYNAGETAERLVTTEIFKQKWQKDNVNWWTDGDISANETAWQIKDESNATFCNLEQFIRNGWMV